MSQPTNGAAKAGKPELTILHVRIEKTLDRELEIQSAKLDKPKRQLVEDAIRAWLQTRAA